MNAGDLKQMLAVGRDEIQARHAAGAGGREIAMALTDLCDRAIGEAHAAALDALPVEERRAVSLGMAVAAVGGYGRRDLAPFSDVDLLFLHARAAPPIVGEFISALLRGLWDIGLKPSQSVRTPDEAIAFAHEDLKYRTAVTEVRLLAGSPALFAEFGRRVDRLFSSFSVGRFLNGVLEERVREHRDHVAESVYLLEPNVKTSPGGLRDLHLLGWVARVRYGTRDPAVLGRKGILRTEDAAALAEAGEFLQRLRNELHFQAGTAQDVLTREEQLRLAKWLGFADDGALLGVERFMQYYYRRTTDLHDAVERFVSKACEPSPLRRFINRLMTYRVAEHLMLKRDSIALDRAAPAGALARAETLVELFDLARGYGVPVAHESVERVRAAVPACRVTGETRAAFLRQLARPNGLGEFLRNLLGVGLLERLLPAFEHARCLIQFNLMHKYTVDEHSLRAVEAAARRLEDRGPIGTAYREIHRKDILHLALLVHDSGKGLGDDHCEVGRRIAEETAEQFGLGDHEHRLFVFLVHRHLLMAHTAFRRDVADPKTLVQFARDVATPEALRMLYVLTAADTEAVAPRELTAWKESLLEELYVRATEELTGEMPPAGESPVAGEQGRVQAVRRGLLEMLRAGFDAEWLAGQLEATPLGYLLSTEPGRIAADLRVLQGLERGGVRVASEHDAAMDQGVYTVFTHDDLTPGLFCKIAGVLAGSGFEVVSARIVTRADGVVVDTFRGHDRDFSGEPPEERRLEIARRIEDVLLGRRAVESLLTPRRTRPGRSGAGVHGEAGPCGGPAQVEIDNESSDRYTILEVFAEDRPGLLYAIARTLFECGLSVHSAKISTHYDQIVDAFYVTTAGGDKVTDAGGIEAIRRRLVEAI